MLGFRFEDKNLNLKTINFEIRIILNTYDWILDLSQKKRLICEFFETIFTIINKKTIIWNKYPKM